MKSRNRYQAEQSEPRGALLALSDPEDLRWKAQEVQLAIARRAYKLFESRGREHGHDCEDWFLAESELLRPVSISIAESEDWIRVQANVFGFEEKEVSISVEPRKITILGRKEPTTTETEGGKVEYIDWSPDQIFQVIQLEKDVKPEGTVVELETGVLRFELPKAAKYAVDATPAAA